MPARQNTIDCKKIVLLVSASLLALFTVRYLFSDLDGTMGSTEPAVKPLFKFENIPGYFMQDEDGVDGKGFDYRKHNLGLISRDYPSDSTVGDPNAPAWKRFTIFLNHLNANAPAGTSYKLIYLGRHGEGEHNLGEAKYGTKAWDDYWSKLDGDGELFWDDAHLTTTGKQQALDAHDFFQKQLREDVAMPAPEKYVVSPLYRCLQTANLTFKALDLPDGQPFQPLIKELIREVMGEHTCDRRSTRSLIASKFPDFEIETGFSEQDELWLPDHRETHAEHDVRTQHLLEEVWLMSPDAQVLSFTSHSGTIASHQRVLGHREFRLQTGGVMPVLVKATKLS